MAGVFELSTSTARVLNAEQPELVGKMSHEEDLIDYSDEEIGANVPVPASGAAAGSNGKKADLSAATDVDKKGSYVGIHSTGFRDFLLKPELLRAIGDCGFEHPSEGQS